MSDSYVGADFYDCDESAERLSYDTEYDALERHLDDLAEKGDSLTDVARRLGEVTVYAWRRVPFDVAAWCEAEADSLADDVRERLADEFGGPDGEAVFSRAERLEIARSLAAELTRHLRHFAPWRCERCGERTYTADEVVALLGGIADD